MSRMALVAFVATITMNTAHAGLCELTRGESGTCRAADSLGRWQDWYVDRFLSIAPEHRTPFWGPSNGWDVVPLQRRIGGDDMDRCWYAYLDRGRYRFLDETQYTLLDGPAGWWWRWRYRIWLDAMNLSWSAPARAGRDTPQIVPEPGTAAFLALGAVVAFAARRRRQPRQET